MRITQLKTIRQQAIAMGAILATIIGLQFAAGSGLGYTSLHSIQYFAGHTLELQYKKQELQSAIESLRLDIVQIQQNLQDLSATRGLNGLDEGDDIAARYAEKFKVDIAQAITLSQALQADELAAKLQEVKASFPAYYDMGLRMTNIYVAQGAEAGNAMMPEFDKAASGLNDALDAAAAALQVEQQKLSEQVEQDLAAAHQQNWLAIALILTVGVLGLAVVYGLWRQLMRASATLSSAVEVTTKAALGDLNVRNIRIGRTDEIGDLLGNINRMLDITEAFTKEAQTAMEYANRRKYFRKIIPTGLLGNFALYAATINSTLAQMAKRDEEVAEFVDRNVRQVAETVATAAAGLNGHVTTIALYSDETRDKAGTASGAAIKTETNMQTVAAAIEEMSASINEISSQMSMVASSASEAVGAVEDADRIVKSLAQAAARIGTVVELINDIAGQTNLLALNATIEAARAGEAGKGFAVVASEVKNLATQTSKSTEEITQQINAVQQVVGEVSKSITDINGRVKVIGEASNTVAAAVEEQRAVTSSISGNVSEVTAAAKDVTEVMKVVSVTATESNSVVKEISSSSSHMASEADRLRQQIGGFMEKIRAAG